MSEEKREKRDVLNETDDEARQQVKQMLRTARHGAFATLEAEAGHPLASRTAIANDIDGTPIILVSALSSHTPAIRANSACSLLIGEPGKGDPLAHPRLTWIGHAEEVKRDNPVHPFVRSRFLRRHPKAELYVDFGDFAFFRINGERISLNGGFAKAFALTVEDATTPAELPWREMDTDVITHMNEDHADAVQLFASDKPGEAETGWRMTHMDREGFEVAKGDDVRRIWFSRKLEKLEEVRPMIIAMTKRARGDAQ